MYRDKKKYEEYFKSKISVEDSAKLKSEEILKKVQKELEEVGIFEEVKVQPQSSTKEEGKQFTVYMIKGNTLVLIDDKGNGREAPLTDEYKDVSVGDIVYI